MPSESYSESHSADLFQTGGSLAADAPTYVERDADEALYQGIRAREFCYVLNSRQMGKSSLRVRTMQRLQAEGCACANIDITLIGSQQVNADRWYAGLIRSLASSFELTNGFNLRSWLREHEDLTPVQRLGEFIESVLLEQITQPIVIFVDEIDSVLSLNFPTDDLFTFIRACYNQRVDNPAYGRLVFVLLGVATPADLVRDKTRTPFNVGRAIELTGLRFEQGQPLVDVLAKKLANPAAVLQSILAWTGGQPFLTQKLCRLVAEHSGVGAALSSEAVDQLVQTQVIANWEAQDDQDHLRTIQARILQDERKAGRLLGIYQQVQQQGAVPYDGSPEQMELRLSGLVVAHQGRLKVYNRVYEQVFNADWVNQALGRLRPYAEAIAAWLVSDRQDDSRLLRGQALIDAQGWALDKNLGAQDYEFLAASRELDLKEVQAALATQQEANQILAAANAKAAKRLTLSTAGAALAIGLALITGGWGLTTAQGAKQVEEESKVISARAEAESRQARADVDQSQREVFAAREEQIDIRQRTEEQVKDAKQQVEAAKTQVATVRQERQRAQAEVQQALSERQQAENAAEKAEIAAKTARNQQNLAERAVAAAATRLGWARQGIDLERRSAT
ncbi:MAG: AAA-like domain-containing protein, partial [Cyanobacteria bacterium Co-bin13]|nr:AAA-like domain-containing protein [Cyanobacteria bacterium Co-bin13]